MTTPAATTPPDGAALDELGRRIEGDLAGAMTVGLIYLGDRLGLFTALRDGGSATSAELAARTGLVERYVREWLAGMATARYIDYDPATERFTLTPAQTAIFADPSTTAYSAPMAQLIVKLLEQADGVAEAFRHGGGVPYSAYDPGVMEAMERDSIPVTRTSLVHEWLPALPGVAERLRAGGTMLDVGCGAGHACIAVATAFPGARVVGIDPHGPSIARARTNAVAAGVAERVRFEAVTVEDLPPDHPFDLITSFDVIHDLVDPAGVLRGIRRLLAPDGAYMMVEPNAAGRLEQRVNARTQFRYGVSVFYCLTVSLAHGGAGFGTCMGETTARELAAAAGFSSFTRIPVSDPHTALYHLLR